MHAVADPEMSQSLPAMISSTTLLEQHLQWLEALLLGAQLESASERRERCGQKGTAVQTHGGRTVTDIKMNGDICNGATHFPPTSSQTHVGIRAHMSERHVSTYGNMGPYGCMAVVYI